MHSRTIETPGRLEKASWFSRVGINEGSGVAVVTSPYVGSSMRRGRGLNVV
jgi:hypothetical protein